MKQPNNIVRRLGGGSMRWWRVRPFSWI